MAEKRRGPGRPAYDSRQKLVAAACALLSERGFEAMSPTMILQRSGIGHGSLYHHFRGNEDLVLDAISCGFDLSSIMIRARLATRLSTSASRRTAIACVVM
jgi:AcrR family transcriptional regulator